MHLQMYVKIIFTAFEAFSVAVDYIYRRKKKQVLSTIVLMLDVITS
jgi:hypothetical protein